MERSKNWDIFNVSNLLSFHQVDREWEDIEASNNFVFDFSIHTMKSWKPPNERWIAEEWRKKLRSLLGERLKWRKIPILINGKNYFISFEFDWHVWNGKKKRKEMLRDKQHTTKSQFRELSCEPENAEIEWRKNKVSFDRWNERTERQPTSTTSRNEFFFAVSQNGRNEPTDCIEYLKIS